nr:hypothetical protein MACL_00001666 [Theileria orientalis]
MASNVKFNRVTHRRVALLFDNVVQSALVLYFYIAYVLVKLLSVRFNVYKLARRCLFVKALGVKQSSLFSVVTCSILLFINNYLSHGATLSKFMLDNTNMKGKVALVTG